MSTYPDSDNWLLDIIVRHEPTEPVHDWITAKVSSLMREAGIVDRIRGPLICPVCGCVDSPNEWRRLQDGTMIASIATHIVERHRAEVPRSEIARLVELMGVEKA